MNTIFCHTYLLPELFSDLISALRKALLPYNDNLSLLILHKPEFWVTVSNSGFKEVSNLQFIHLLHKNQTLFQIRNSLHKDGESGTCTNKCSCRSLDYSDILMQPQSQLYGHCIQQSEVKLSQILIWVFRLKNIHSNLSDQNYIHIQNYNSKTKQQLHMPSTITPSFFNSNQ